MPKERKELTVEQLARAASPETVVVRVPLAVLWDFDSLTNLKRQVLDRLGCTACTSGVDIRWKGAREFVVNPAKLEPRELIEL